MSKPLRFVVIDDDTLAIMITSRMIKIYLPDANVESFTDAEVALAEIGGQTEKDTHRTIVFLDINMPGLDGWQFLERFKEMGDCVSDPYRIYMLSSSIDNRDKERAATYPCVAGMLGKPLTPEHIRMIVAKEV